MNESPCVSVCVYSSSSSHAIAMDDDDGRRRRLTGGGLGHFRAPDAHGDADVGILAVGGGC